MTSMILSGDETLRVTIILEYMHEPSFRIFENWIEK